MDGSGHRQLNLAQPSLGAQPATPRMLRSVSSMRSSKSEVDEPKSHSRTPSSTRIPSNYAPKPDGNAEKELLPAAPFTPPPVVNSKEKQHASHLQKLQPGMPLNHHPLLQQQQLQQQFHRKSIGDWDFIRTIGAGSMGKVKLARHNSTNEKCAVKIVPRAAKLYQRAHSSDPPMKTAEEAAQRQKEFEKEVARDKRTIREGALGRLLFHPHICRLYEMVPMTNHYYMLFEYVEGGQLLDYIVSHGSLNEKYARKFARGIALALDYCHRNNVVHRDLKIENIMINQKGDIKIIDFGLSNLYSPKSLLKTYCGSLYFAAPELLSAKPYTGPEVDIWSFGVVLYVLVCGKVPFDDPVVSVLHEKIKKGNVEYPSFISKECMSLLSRMLVVDPHKRATLHEVIQHPWMNKGYEYAVPSYMAKRIPLTLPLDPEIIRNIASFDLGSAQAIMEELTTIVSSVEYQMSSENWYKNAKQGKPYTSAPNNQILLDPTSGFHPLISIYFLVDEMRKRKRAKEEALRAQTGSQVDEAELRQSSLPNYLPPPPQQVPQQAPPVASPKLPANFNSTKTPHRATELESKNPFNPNAGPVSALPQRRPVQQIPSLQFPEQAHAHTMSTSLSRNSQSPRVSNEEADRPLQQQLLLPRSPRNSIGGEDSLDPNAGKPLNFNSLLRRLSTKKNTTPSPTKSSQREEHVNLDHAVGLPKPRISQDSSNRLSPESSLGSNRIDPMVRRGMSMKVTAKEKSSGSRVNIAKEPMPNPRDRPAVLLSLDPGSSKSHSRSASTSGSNKFHGFIPVEYLPPLPNITVAGAPPQPEKTETTGENTPLHAGRKFHPTARAKSVGGHSRKDSYYNRGNHHPALPNTMAFQNSDEGVDTGRGHERHDDAFFDDVTLDDSERAQLPRLTEEQIVDQFNHARRNSMPSIEYPKTLFLKGFFSVQTTSTKPLPVIRYNILNVLSKLGVKFQEVKGGFVCVHSPSLTTKHDSSDEETPNASTIIDEYSREHLDDNSEEKSEEKSEERSEERRLYGDAFKSSSDSLNKFREVPDRSKTPETDSLQTPQLQTPHQSSKPPSRQPSLHLNTNMLSPPSGSGGHKGHRSSNSIGSTGHRRKFSIGQSILNYRKKNGSQTLIPPTTPASARLNRLLLGSVDLDDEDLDEETRAQLQQFADDNSVDSLSGIMVGGGSDMLISSRIEQRARHQRSRSTSIGQGYEDEEEGAHHSSSHAARKTPLKFEINIVKVPLVGLYGVQFKKTLGNTWNYKTLASQILNELNL